MKDLSSVSAPPSLAVSMAVRGPVGAAVEGRLDAARAAIELEIARILDALGVPGSATVELAADAGSAAVRDWIVVHLEGHPCPYPETLLTWVLAAVAERLPETGDLGEQAAALLSGEDAGSRAVRFLAVMAGELVKLAPSRLLGSDQLLAYATDLADAAPDVAVPQPEVLWPALRAVLDARSSIGDHLAVCDVLRAAGGEDADELRELLLDALMGDRIGLEVPTGFGPRLGTGVPDPDGSDLLGFTADALVDELGVAFPPFAVSENGAPGVFTVALNDLPMLPTPLLREDEILVNDTAERLALMEVEARGTINPATGQPASVAALADRDQLDLMGLTTWDPPGFLVLTLADALRRHAGCFVTTTMIDAQLLTLAAVTPTLVDTARQTLPLARITAIARALVSEQVSIQDLRAVLERLVDLPYASTVPGRWALLDDPAFAGLEWAHDGVLSDGRLVRFAREGLRRRIVHRHARGTTTLVVYLLAPAIEQQLLEDGGPPDEAYEQLLLHAIGEELSYLPATAMVPAILTLGEVRAAVHAAIRATYPRIPVLAYDELTPDVNIQPVARISLAEPEA